jgi:hypothetical protein
LRPAKTGAAIALQPKQVLPEFSVALKSTQKTEAAPLEKGDVFGENTMLEAEAGHHIIYRGETWQESKSGF